MKMQLYFFFQIWLHKDFGCAQGQILIISNWETLRSYCYYTTTTKKSFCLKPPVITVHYVHFQHLKEKSKKDKIDRKF